MTKKLRDNFYMERNAKIVADFELFKFENPEMKIKEIKELLADRYCMSEDQIMKIIYRKKK